MVMFRVFMFRMIFGGHHHIGMVITNHPEITHFVSTLATKAIRSFFCGSLAFKHCFHWRFVIIPEVMVMGIASQRFQTLEMIGTQFRLAFEPGDQATHLLLAPALLLTVGIQIQLAFLGVVDHIRIRLHQLLEFLLAGSNREGSVLDAIDKDQGISIEGFEFGRSLG